MLLSRQGFFPFAWAFPALHRRALARLAEIRRTAAGRRAIARMDARMLADIGLSHGQAQHEINRPFWDTKPQI